MSGERSHAAITAAARDVGVDTPGACDDAGWPGSVIADLVPGWPLGGPRVVCLAPRRGGGPSGPRRGRRGGRGMRAS